MKRIISSSPPMDGWFRDAGWSVFVHILADVDIAGDLFWQVQAARFFKFLDLRLKLPDLEIGKVHGKLKIINAFAKISSFFQKSIGRFAFEKYAEFVERAKWMFDSASVIVLFFLPTHGVFPNINKIATSKHRETHPALETAGRSGWYLYNRMMGSFCQ